MKAIVTGAAGFIGSHLVDKLLKLGYHVVGIDNLCLGNLSNLKSAKRSKRFSLHTIEINNVSALQNIFKKEGLQDAIESVWHFAANSDIRSGVANFDVDLNNTYLTTYNILKVMRDYAPTRLFFASTSAVYGVNRKPLSEKTGPLFPISSYGAMKLASEAVISAALESYLSQATIYRFPNVVGARATHGAVYDFLRKVKANRHVLEVLGDGSQQKPYLHVSDLIEAMMFINTTAQEKLRFYNIAPEKSSTTVSYIANKVCARIGGKTKIQYTGGTRGWVGDVPKFSYSTRKLRRLGWRPRLTSNEAVDLAIQEIYKEIF